MENLHLVTEWNYNGMECNANGIEWNGMEWNGMKSFVQNRCKIRQKRSPGLSKFEFGSLAIRGRRGVTRHDFGKYSFFLTYQLNQQGRDRWRTGGTSPRQHAKKPAKVSKNRPQSLQNRALEPPKLNLEPSKTLFLKDLSFKKAQEGLSSSFGEPK